MKFMLWRFGMGFGVCVFNLTITSSTDTAPMQGHHIPLHCTAVQCVHYLLAHEVVVVVGHILCRFMHQRDQRFLVYARGDSSQHAQLPLLCGGVVMVIPF